MEHHFSLIMTNNICGRCLKDTDDLITARCSSDPEEWSSVGMAHCGDCGAMLLAGQKHWPICRECHDFLEDSIENYGLTESGNSCKQTKQVFILANIYTDNEGNPTCALNFKENKFCFFLKTQSFGTQFTCGLSEFYGDGDQVIYRENEISYLTPYKNCPLWKLDKQAA